MTPTKRIVALLVGLLLLFLAHGMALLYRVQPAVSLWFPPSGIAILLTLWLGPIGAVLTAIVSVLMAPYWGSAGWARWVGVTDIVEPLVAWALYRACFRGTLPLKGLNHVIAFIVSAPLAASAASALVGCLALLALGKLTAVELGETIGHWWVGNAIGIMTIAPIGLVLLTSRLRRQGWIPRLRADAPFALTHAAAGWSTEWSEAQPEGRSSQPILQQVRRSGLEIVLILSTILCVALLTVHATQFNIFIAVQLSLLGVIPIIWAAVRFGVRGGILVSSLSVLITLFNYLWVYPNALTLPYFPVDANLLHTHKLSLLLQGTIGLVVGTAITERAASQVALAVEQVRREELHRRKQEFEALVENSPDVIVRFDRQLRFVYVNPAIEQATGVLPQSFLGKTLAEVGISAAAYQPWQAKLHRVLSTGQPETDEFSLPAPDGVLHFYQTRLVPEFDASGTPASILTVTRDITYLKRTEAALRHSEELSRTVLENFPNGGVFLFDRHLHYVLAEGMGLAKVGLTKAALENKTLWQTLPPENHPMIELAYRNTVAGQTSRFETSYGGHVYDVDVLPLKNDRNEVVMGMAIIQDITERKQIEVALSQANDRFRLAAAAVNCMIYDWDSQQGLVLRTEGLLRILGYAPEEVEPTQEWWWQQIHPEDQKTLPTSIAATSLVDNRYTLEYRVRHKQGHYVYVLDQGLVLRDEAGNPLRVVGSTTDISDRKQNEAERTELLAREQAARQQAESASRMKDEFLAVVSHELRSPLNAILGWSRLLRTRRLEPDKVEQALESIERNAQAQTQLIEDLLDISRIIRGKIRLSPCPTHLAPVIQAALDTVRPAANSKSIQLDVHLDAAAGLVSADPDRVQQVVWNLLSNAVKFTPMGGRVEIRLESIGSAVQIQVRDTGKGIHPDFLPYVFERFRQADATTTRSQGGLGLGLAIVRNLVELHGGEVSVQSPGEGQGSTFTVQLPRLIGSLESSPVDLLPHRQTTLEIALNLEGLKILAVDDELDSREFLKAALEQYGATVITAASVAEALRLFQLHQPNVLLSDIGMPGEDGYSLIRTIRSLPSELGGMIPAAALTAYAREGDRLAALNAGFQMHVPKPIEPLQLVQVIAKLTGRLRDSVLH